MVASNPECALSSNRRSGVKRSLADYQKYQPFAHQSYSYSSEFRGRLWLSGTFMVVHLSRYSAMFHQEY